tara:strand:- start:11 stop:994 length:984 start_codon:yes stop_codon:yes gene_type:complete
MMPRTESGRPNSEKSQPAITTPTTRIIDGGLSTQLETQGIDLKKYPTTWTAGLLSTKEGQGQLSQAHQSYITAGAQIILTSSYQTSPTMSDEILTTSIKLALDCRDRVDKNVDVYVSLGPYGATLADGSEYTGIYPSNVTSETLTTFHSARLSKLLQNNNPVDGLAFETIPNLLELQCILHLLSSAVYSKLPAWITFSSKDGVHCCDGTSLSEAIHLCVDSFAAVPGVRYIGLNCVHPSVIDDFLQVVLPIVIEHPTVFQGIVLYPNNGGEWDAKKRCWCDMAGNEGFSEKAKEWRNKIIETKINCLIGGCCSTNAEHILKLSESLK